MQYQEAVETFEHLFTHKMSDEAMRELLIRLYDRGESAQEIAAAAMVMRAHSIKLPIPEDMEFKIMDNCGTGGDKSGSFNISTTVSLLLASMGSLVAKHGNRSITSRSGSADVLEALGIHLNLSVDEQVQMLKEVGFAFIFAVNHHPAMKFIMPIRKSIEHRTIFNILGPLTNPAGVKKQLIGVFDPDYIQRVAKALELNSAERAMVVSSKDGMDEIGISTVSFAAKLDAKGVSEMEIDPERYGFKLADSQSIKGGDARENAAILEGILKGDIHGPKRDVVLLNAAAALWVDGKARDMKEGIEMAKEAIDSAKAAAHLSQIIRMSQSFA